MNRCHAYGGAEPSLTCCESGACAPLGGNVRDPWRLFGVAQHERAAAGVRRGSRAAGFRVASPPSILPLHKNGPMRLKIALHEM